MKIRVDYRIRWGSILLTALAIAFMMPACTELQGPSLVDPGGDSSDGGIPPDDFWTSYRDIDGDELIHHVDSCTVCHLVFSGTTNLRFIPEILGTPNSGDRAVIFLSRTGLNSFADGDEIYDGICEVCHTQTSHHLNNSSGDHEHHAGSDCIACHSHALEFSPSGGGSGPSHLLHTEGGNGISLACDYCHLSDLSSFQDGEPFETTHVCDECHSPGGMIDGVDDPAVGARNNWTDGVYDGEVLMTGKDRWCGGCHDLGNSIIAGVAAPAVVGNGSWGYYSTGHGRNDVVTCTDCHDTASPHFDGISHSYVAADDNYQVAFRLSDVNGSAPLNIPRFIPDAADAWTDPPYYELCFSCHDKYILLGSPAAPAGPFNMPEILTNFRSDSVLIIPDGLDTDIAEFSISGAADVNSHHTHLAGPPHFYDSDRDGTTDSFGTCVACHNVHGSTSPAMIRDGKLTGIEPGLHFSYVRYDRHNPPQGGCSDPIVMTSLNVSGAASHGGVMRANSGPSANGVCGFCHCSGANTDDPEYIIDCYGPDCVDYYRSFNDLQPPRGR